MLVAVNVLLLAEGLWWFGEVLSTKYFEVCYVDVR